MKVQEIIKELQTKYPGKNIIKNREDNTTEILCEIEPAEKHPNYSKAISVLYKSLPHFHNKTTETYKVLKGNLVLHVGNEIIKLNEGNSYITKPGNVHWAEGDETWIECSSEPGWTSKDHILANVRDVAVVIFYDNKGNIGVQRRESYSKAGEKYGLWGGAKEAGESPAQAMNREIKEELGFVPHNLKFWAYFIYVVDDEGKYKNWVINHDVFLSPITDKLLKAKVLEGDAVEVMSLNKALEEPDFRLIKPLLLRLKSEILKI